ncbi:MAG: SDR family oxidoreductase [Pseudomonadales bacterium]|nr:SDR family oxidoreductase [Pseudomonadales bacterium]
MQQGIFGALIAAAVVALTACGTTGGDPQGKVLLVIGATGGTGEQVVTQALAQGYRVRALVRNEPRARDLLGDKVKLYVGDVRDPSSMASAFRGADYVISALGSNSRRDPENKPEVIDFGGTKSIAELAHAAGVRQLVIVSSMGVTDPNHPLNKLLDNIMAWKLRGEEAVRASGVRYTIVRPAGLSTEPGGTQGIHVTQGDPKDIVARIPRADVAAVCLAALGRRAAYDTTFEVMTDKQADRVDWDTLFGALHADGG